MLRSRWASGTVHWASGQVSPQKFEFQIFFLNKRSRWASVCAQRGAPGAKIRSKRAGQVVLAQRFYWTKDFVGAWVMLAGQVGAS